MFGKNPKDSVNNVDKDINPQPSLKYESAYAGILPSDALEKTNDNIPHTLEDVLRGIVPPSILRSVSDSLSLPKKLEVLKRATKNITPTETNDHDALNYKTLFLFDDSEHLDWHDKTHKTTDLFPKNKENEWPVLVITSNSNLVSPQVYFDGFEAAKKLVPHVTGRHENDKTIVMGTYFSRNCALANTEDTLKRICELKKDQDDILTLSPAAHIQAGQLLNFLVDRDNSGNVIIEQGRPLLRQDADKIMKHIIGYGYSGAHLTNKDSFRTLRDILEQGHVTIKVTNGDISFRPSVKADAQKILPNARLVGIAGADGFDEWERNMPKEVNFISPADKIIALHGKKFLKGPDIIEITPLKNKKYCSDHDQQLYVDAILDPQNNEAVKTARTKLSPSFLSR